jgi:uncharacterized protein YhfF
MKKKIKLEITEVNLTSLVDMIDTLSAMVGTGDDSFDKGMQKHVKMWDKILEKHGFYRKHN